METPEPADDLAPLLNPGASPADVLFRERLRRCTERRLRRRRVRRRLLLAGALAACYAAGLATFWLLRPPPPEPQVIEVVRVEKVPAGGAVPPAPRPQLSGYDLELLAEQADGPEAAELFRAAGDRYLNDEGNYKAALRCYAHYLDLAPASERVVSAGSDNWLLIALKNDRFRENGYAN
ncbi:MAG TPA: hypothetical protein VIL46_04185 [Gemmataceae bacterium]